jgi:hypothetical protein
MPTTTKSAATVQAITEHVGRVRRLLSRCAETLTAFDTEIIQILRLTNIGDYASVIDCFYLFEDTELAKSYVRQNGIGTMPDQARFGLVYLKFYGLMNACYLQQQAVLVCTGKLQLHTDLSHVKSSRIVQYRNDFAAHSPNRGSGRAEHSYILDRFGLLEGRVSGYTSNSAGGAVFRDAELHELLAEWDDCFLRVLSPVCDHITSLILEAGVRES